MLQDPATIRHYQRLTDSLVNLWERGRRYDELQLYCEGYLACLRQANLLEAYFIHRLEEDIFRFLRDPSNFELSYPPPQPDFY